MKQKGAFRDRLLGHSTKEIIQRNIEFIVQKTPATAMLHIVNTLT